MEEEKRIEKPTIGEWLQAFAGIAVVLVLAWMFWEWKAALWNECRDFHSWKYCMATIIF
jgi:hypothetical protein